MIEEQKRQAQEEKHHRLEKYAGGWCYVVFLRNQFNLEVFAIEVSSFCDWELSIEVFIQTNCSCSLLGVESEVAKAMHSAVSFKFSHIYVYICIEIRHLVSNSDSLWCFGIASRRKAVLSWGKTPNPPSWPRGRKLHISAKRLF